MYERAVLTTPTWSREVKVDIAMFCEQLTDDFLEIEPLWKPKKPPEC